MRDELELFASLSGSPESAARFAAWVAERWDLDESRPSWCFIVERGSGPVGRILYWSFPAHRDPFVLSGLQLGWEDEDYLDSGRALLLESLPAISRDGATSLETSVAADLPFAEKRRELLTALPLPVLQQKRRFVLRDLASGDASAERAGSRLRFVAMSETTRESFREMIERVTEGTLDRSDAGERRLHGPVRASERYIELLEEIDPDTSLWQLAWDRERCIGLVVPQRLDDERGTINYIGVVPEARGNGYIDDLLRRGLELLHENRMEKAVVDVDALNLPVTASLERTGWSETGVSWRFDLATARMTGEIDR